MKSLILSDFKKWINNSFQESGDKEAKLRDLVNTNGLVMFFQKDDSMFGCPENGRIAFARMKSEDGMDDANFVALKLSSDEPARHIIQSDDLDKLKIVDLEDVIEKIMGK